MMMRGGRALDKEALFVQCISNNEATQCAVHDE